MAKLTGKIDGKSMKRHLGHQEVMSEKTKEVPQTLVIDSTKAMYEENGYRLGLHVGSLCQSNSFKA